LSGIVRSQLPKRRTGLKPITEIQKILVGLDLPALAGQKWGTFLRPTAGELIEIGGYGLVRF